MADFVENGQGKVQILATLLKVLQVWVLLIQDTFALVLDLSLRESLNIPDPLYELLAHGFD